MSTFLGFVADVLGSVVIPLAVLAKSPESGSSTSFAIGIGGLDTGDNNTGGSIPHLAFWDINGHRIGQYKGNEDGHINQNMEHKGSIQNYQTVPKGEARQPEYVMISTQEKDAICISYVYASGNGAQWAWYGDIGFNCGADWFLSNFKVGSGTYSPKCVWIDHDHTNNLRYQGFSLHMPDFSSTDGRVTQFTNNPDTLCKSSPRMKFWENITPNGLIPFFKPPLKYTDGGADANPARVIDKVKRSIGSSRHFSRNNGNNKPGHLIVSSMATHSAKELCESGTSVGPDFVSTTEGVFCDMSEKEWWYLCSPDVLTGCFDLKTEKMVGRKRPADGPDGKSSSIDVRDTATGRVIPDKSYTTTVEWN